MSSTRPIFAGILELLESWNVRSTWQRAEAEAVALPNKPPVSSADNVDRWSVGFLRDPKSVPAFARRFAERNVFLDWPITWAVAALDTFERDHRFWTAIGSPQYSRPYHVVLHIAVLSVLDGLRDGVGRAAGEPNYHRGFRTMLAKLSADTDGDAYSQALSPYAEEAEIEYPTEDPPDFADFAAVSAGLLDMVLDRFKPAPNWDGERMDDAFERIFAKAGSSFLYHVWRFVPHEALVVCCETPGLIDGEFLWDIARLYRFWRQKGRPIFENPRMLEHFLCAFLYAESKKPASSRGPGGHSDIPDTLVDADRNVRRFCERVSVGLASSPFALQMAWYDRRGRSTGPLLPEAFLADLESNSKLFSAELRRQRTAERRGRADAAKSSQRRDVSVGTEVRP